jgi:hypothetical protein
MERDLESGTYSSDFRDEQKSATNPILYSIFDEIG